MMAGEAAVADDVQAQGAKKGSSGMMKIIMIIVAAAVIMGVSIGTAVWVSKSMIHETIASKGDGGEAAAAEGDGEAGGGHGEAAPAKKKRNPHGAPVYMKLGDAFIVNFLAGDQIRYLQISIEAMSRDPEVEKDIEAHLPVIRNNLVMLFSGLDFETISTVEGKQKIREMALHEVQKILEEQTGYKGIEELYFTSFVMQ